MSRVRWVALLSECNKKPRNEQQTKYCQPIDDVFFRNYQAQEVTPSQLQ